MPFSFFQWWWSSSSSKKNYRNVSIRPTLFPKCSPCNCRANGISHIKLTLKLEATVWTTLKSTIKLITTTTTTLTRPMTIKTKQKNQIYRYLLFTFPLFVLPKWIKCPVNGKKRRGKLFPPYPSLVCTIWSCEWGYTVCRVFHVTFTLPYLNWLFAPFLTCHFFNTFFSSLIFMACHRLIDTSLYYRFLFKLLIHPTA